MEVADWVVADSEVVDRVVAMAAADLEEEGLEEVAMVVVRVVDLVEEMVAAREVETAVETVEGVMEVVKVVERTIHAST